MTSRGLVTLAFAGLLSVAAAVTLPAIVRAQAGGGTPAAPGGLRVGTVEMVRVFNDMQETKDLRQRAEAERARLMATQKEKQDELQTMSQSRAQFKPDHPQYEEINRKLLRASVEFKNWGEFAQMDFERNQKRLMKARFEKIQAAVAEVAQRDGIDLVLSKSQPEIPDDLDRVKAEELNAIMRQRDVLYTSPRTDITDQVLALLDAKYKAAGGANTIGATFGAPTGGAPAQGGGAATPAGARTGGAPAIPQQPQPQQQQPPRRQP
jgi:Skp family chaperone for outer membrane proteins